MRVPPAPADPAATVVVLRGIAGEFEVLMVHRHPRGFFGGLVVFPGGGVDEVDRSELANQVVKGEFDDQHHRAAALRELAEETGLAAIGSEVTSAPNSRGAQLYQDLADSGVRLAGDSLVLISRWVTPEMAPRRFDTRFYLLVAGDTPPIRIDEDELVDHDWVTPLDALRHHEEGDWPMFLPTLAHLRWLHRRTSAADAVLSARGADGRTLIEPRRMEDRSLVPIYVPADEP